MREKRDNLYLHYFMTYFIILMVTMLFCIVYYFRTVAIVREDAVNQNTSLLNQAVQILEERTTELNHFCEYLVTTPEVAVFQSEADPFTYPNSYSLNRLRNSLSAFQPMDTFVKNYFIFFQTSGLVVNNMITYPYDQFQRIVLQYEGMDYEAWMDYMKALENSPGYHKEIPASYLGEEGAFLHYSYPLISITHDAGFVLFLIDSKQFLDIFSQIDYTDGLIYICNEDGDIMTFSSDMPYSPEEIREQADRDANDGDNAFISRIDGKAMLVTSSHSDKLGLRFVCVQPESRILSRVTSLKIWMAVLFFLAFLIGVLLCLHMSRKPADSLNDILRVISLSDTPASSGNIVADIRKNILFLKHNNAQMTEILSRHAPYIRRTFLERLLKGDFSQEKDAIAAAEALDSDYNNSCFRVVIFRFLSEEAVDNPDTLQYLDTCKLALTEVLEGMDSPPLYTDSEEKLVVALITYPSDEEGRVHEYMENLVGEIRKPLPAVIRRMFTVIVGDEVAQLTEVVRSYENAHSLLHLPWPDTQELFWYQDRPANWCAYFFPADAQNKLFTYVTTGNQEGLHDLLHSLFSRNLIDGNMPYYMQTLFLNDLQSSFVKIMNQLSLTESDSGEYQDILKNMHSAADVEKPNLIIHMYYSLCELVSRRKHEEKESLIAEVLAFIDGNYADKNLSLTWIAERFHYSESYLSLLLTQYGEIHFSEYVESLRLGKAKELLRGTKLTITEIADRVGYVSTNSFCRAFKRFAGCTATGYRDKMEL